jgi:hypothetical protein
MTREMNRWGTNGIGCHLHRDKIVTSYTKKDSQSQASEILLDPWDCTCHE